MRQCRRKQATQLVCFFYRTGLARGHLMSHYLCMTSQTTTITSTETGFTYEITVDDGTATATIAWEFDGEDHEIESGCPNGVLLACDVPDADQGLLASCVVKLGDAAEPAAVRVVKVQAGDSHGAVDADLVVVVAGKPVNCSVTLWHDEGQPTVRRRHPLGTCGTERYGWADGTLDAAFTEAEDADEDYDCRATVDAIIYAVDESAIDAGL